jgi:hypothetical protein
VCSNDDNDDDDDDDDDDDPGTQIFGKHWPSVCYSLIWICILFDL